MLQNEFRRKSVVSSFSLAYEAEICFNYFKSLSAIQILFILILNLFLLLGFDSGSSDQVALMKDQSDSGRAPREGNRDRCL